MTGPDERPLWIATAPRRDSLHWEQLQITRAEIIAYLDLDNPAGQKDCGGFVMGELAETTVRHTGAATDCTGLHRRKDAVESRSGLVFDADRAGRSFVPDTASALDCGLIVYTTWSHTPESPRYRVVVPLSRDVTPSEFTLITNAVMADLGRDQFDPGSSEPSRLMHRPSSQNRAEYQPHVIEGPPLDADLWLARAKELGLDVEPTTVPPRSPVKAQRAIPEDFVQKYVSKTIRDLDVIAALPEGAKIPWPGEKDGVGWDKGVLFVAGRLIQAANSGTSYTTEQAHSDFMEHAPASEGSYDRGHKWGEAVKYEREQGNQGVPAYEFADDVFDPVVSEADEPVDEDAFWSARPVLLHLRDYARGARVSPWAMFGVVCARAITMVPPWVVLPPLVGSDASLNLFVGVVSASGGGKGSAERAARNAVDVGSVDVATVGSGEGIAHLFAHREKALVVRHRDAVLFTVPEIDNLVALGARQGATLWPQVRSAWSGEQLGFAYADPKKALPIEEHTYRLTMVLGIQPGRAGPLIEESVSGTPQRFLWMAADDPGAPVDRPPLPDPLTWRQPKWRMDRKGWCVLPVPDVIAVDIDVARVAVLHKKFKALDSHSLLSRLKLAAALGLLDERDHVNEQDWALAGIVMRISDATRGGVVKYLAAQSKDDNTARGRAEGNRAVAASETVADATIKKVSQLILGHLKEHGETPWSDERNRMSQRRRPYFEDAIEALVAAGVVEVEKSERGQLIRLPKGVS